jgi:hypothetical protein
MSKNIIGMYGFLDPIRSDVLQPVANGYSLREIPLLIGVKHYFHGIARRLADKLSAAYISLRVW